MYFLSFWSWKTLLTVTHRVLGCSFVQENPARSIPATVGLHSWMSLLSPLCKPFLKRSMQYRVYCEYHMRSLLTSNIKEMMCNYRSKEPEFTCIYLVSGYVVHKCIKYKTKSDPCSYAVWFSHIWITTKRFVHKLLYPPDKRCVHKYVYINIIVHAL